MTHALTSRDTALLMIEEEERWLAAETVIAFTPDPDTLQMPAAGMIADLHDRREQLIKARALIEAIPDEQWGLALYPATKKGQVHLISGIQRTINAAEAGEWLRAHRLIVATIRSVPEAGSSDYYVRRALLKQCENICVGVRDRLLAASKSVTPQGARDAAGDIKHDLRMARESLISA